MNYHRFSFSLSLSPFALTPGEMSFDFSPPFALDLEYFETYASINDFIFIGLISPLLLWQIWKERDLWASEIQNQQNGMCVQLWLRSAWAFILSDQSSLSAQRKLGSVASNWAHSKDSDQTGKMLKLIRVPWMHKSHCRFCYALAHIN